MGLAVEEEDEDAAADGTSLANTPQRRRSISQGVTPASRRPSVAAGASSVVGLADLPSSVDLADRARRGSFANAQSPPPQVPSAGAAAASPSKEAAQAAHASAAVSAAVPASSALEKVKDPAPVS